MAYPPVASAMISVELAGNGGRRYCSRVERKISKLGDNFARDQKSSSVAPIVFITLYSRFALWNIAV